uniref:Uncharacterized protein n=1 Tax=Lotus japonicus TaxID=34305 RepID=I3T6P5_LOTJA|nr:unknown [Lotus japonicus]
MKMSGRIKPEVELHLSAYNFPVTTPSYINIGLQSIRLSKCSPQKLNVHFIMETRMRFIVRKIKSCYNSCSIPRMELNRSTKVPGSKWANRFEAAS